MATYDKLAYNLPPYQEGNESDFEFDLDDNFPIEQVSNISFQARDARGHLIMPEKSITATTITITDKTVRIPFSADEMKGIFGIHKYEIDFINLMGKPFATIGGNFSINKEINRQ